jgi:hypothetical protein
MQEKGHTERADRKKNKEGEHKQRENRETGGQRENRRWR